MHACCTQTSMQMHIHVKENKHSKAFSEMDQMCPRSIFLLFDGNYADDSEL